MPSYVPPKKLAAVKPKLPYVPPREQADEFHRLIGQITLAHAGIEQDLKSVLIDDWEVPEEEVEKKYGHKLREAFLEKIKERHVPQKYYESYLLIINRFWEASKKRNELIKASYGYTNATGIIKYDLKERRKYDPLIDFDKWKMIGTTSISFQELENLSHELSQIRESNFQLSKRVHIEKLIISRFLPEQVFRNPYKYIREKINISGLIPENAFRNLFEYKETKNRIKS